MSVVETSLGKIEGRDKGKYLAFTGIRYAEAPVGNLRFRPPIPAKPWKGDDGRVYDATQFGPSAPQLHPTDQNLERDPIDEDCLFVNVYTPAADGKRRPVLFWIHGGSYVAGSGRIYNGRWFAEDHDVVVVNINYRMGALGFMHVGHLEDDLGSSVNNGILDQICALEWTRDHIAAFGGDPDNVTIFGESAGGTAIAVLMGSPMAEGLFHKAVVHSPNVDLIPVGQGHIEFTNRCIERLGGDPAVNGMETLRRASLDQLIELNTPDPQKVAKPGLAVRKLHNVGFSPAIDGPVLPRPVAETIASRGKNNVPFMGGGCRHEGTLFAEFIGAGDFTEDEAAALFESEGMDGTKALEVYETFSPGATPREKLVYGLTDTLFRNSMVRIMDAAANAGSTCYSWMLTIESEALDGALRSTHALELFYLWNWAYIVPGMAGPNPPKTLGPAMREYWANFARTGKPTAKGEPDCPAYDTTHRPVLILDAERRIEEDFDGAVRKFWFDEV
jgi:para-nitrobenzyl esterase